MDQHAIGTARAQSLDPDPARILACASAAHCRLDRQSSRCSIELALVILTDDRLNERNLRVIAKCLERPPDDRLSCYELILLWSFTAGPQPSPGSYYNGGNGHGVAPLTAGLVAGKKIAS
jgi:hypothetical protein